MSGDTTNKVWIPEVSKERIVELAAKIKPVVTFQRKGKYFIKPVDLHTVAYIWEPKPADKVTGLKSFCEIRTYHSCGSHGFFMPSIAEVLTQIPDEYLDKVLAFEIIASRQGVYDLNIEREAFNAGYYVATTRLYVKK